MAYAQAPVVHTKTYTSILNKFCKDVNNLDEAYNKCLTHLANVPCNAIGYLPKKYDMYKKLIKTGQKDSKMLFKIMDLEWDRLETSKLSLLHFANANMFLHSQATEIYSSTYDALRKINFENEFPNADKKQLKAILKEKNINQEVQPA